MTARNLNFYNLNSTRSYPLADDATGTADDGAQLPNDILVDCTLRFPVEAGKYAYVGGVTVTARLVTVLIMAADDVNADGGFVPLASITLQKPVQPFVHYPLAARYPGVGGFIVFQNTDAPFAGRFSAPRQGLLLPRCARFDTNLPIPNLRKLSRDIGLTGLVTLKAGTDIEIVKETLLIDERDQDAIVIRLTDVPGRNVLSEYIGPCGHRPESNNCDKEAIQSINEAIPDCNGNLTITFVGLQTAPYTGDGPGVTLDQGVGLDDVCTARALTTATGHDVCGASNSSVGGGGTSVDIDTSSVSHFISSLSQTCGELPWCDNFDNETAAFFVVKEGSFVFETADSPEESCHPGVDSVSAIQVSSLSVVAFSSSSCSSGDVPFNEFSSVSMSELSLASHELMSLDYSSSYGWLSSCWESGAPSESVSSVSVCSESGSAGTTDIAPGDIESINTADGQDPWNLGAGEQTFTQQITDLTNDGRWGIDPIGGPFIDDSIVEVGWPLVVPGQFDERKSFFRFTGVPINPGDTINSAAITLYHPGGAKNALITAYGVLLPDPPAPPDYATAVIDGDTPTTATASFVVPNTGAAAGSIGTPSLVSIVQELQSQFGWAAGNAMIFIMKADPSDEGAIHDNFFSDAAASDGHAAILTINYVSSGGGGANLATDIITAGADTEELHLINYVLSIPAGATILGIEATVSRYSSGTDASDRMITLLDNDVVVGTNKAAGGNWPTTAGTIVYGGPHDLWGHSWTRSSQFGLMIQATGVSAQKLTVVSAELTVYYEYRDSFYCTDAHGHVTRLSSRIEHVHGQYIDPEHLKIVCQSGYETFYVPHRHHYIQTQRDVCSESVSEYRADDVPDTLASTANGAGQDAWTWQGPQTFTQRITETMNDGTLSDPNLLNPNSDLDFADVEIGNPVNGAVEAFFRFTGIPLAAGDTVSGATLTLYQTAILPILMEISGILQPDAAQLTSFSDAMSRPLTTTRVGASGRDGSGVVVLTDMSTIVNEIISQPLWQANNAVMFYVAPEDRNQTPTTFVDFTSTPPNAALLTINYTPPPLPAEVVMGAGETSEVLYIGGFDLPIPPGAVIYGVVATLTRKATGANTTDLIVQLTDNGTLVGDNKALPGDWPATDGTVTYGASHDEWGYEWSADSVFGLAVQVANGTGASTATIESVRLTVYYEYQHAFYCTEEPGVKLIVETIKHTTMVPGMVCTETVHHATQSRVRTMHVPFIENPDVSYTAIDGSTRNVSVWDACAHLSSLAKRITTDLQLLSGGGYTKSNGGIVVNYHLVNPFSSPHIEYFLIMLDRDANALRVMFYTGVSLVEKLAVTTGSPFVIGNWYRLTIDVSLFGGSQVVMTISVRGVTDPAWPAIHTSLLTSQFLPADGLYGLGTDRAHTRFSYFHLQELP